MLLLIHLTVSYLSAVFILSVCVFRVFIGFRLDISCVLSSLCPPVFWLWLWKRCQKLHFIWRHGCRKDFWHCVKVRSVRRGSVEKQSVLLHCSKTPLQRGKRTCSAHKRCEPSKQGGLVGNDHHNLATVLTPAWSQKHEPRPTVPFHTHSDSTDAHRCLTDIPLNLCSTGSRQFNAKPKLSFKQINDESFFTFLQIFNPMPCY